MFFSRQVEGPGDLRHHHHHHRRRRMRRGDVRAAILVLLTEQGRNGYQLMQEIEERSGGTWRPSPGSVYPALQLLADEGLVRSEQREGGNVFELTDAGRSHVEENRERLGEPWAQAEAGVPGGHRELMGLAMQVGIAARQVTHAGSEEQVKAATELLTETRKSLYRILAGD
jgi:DNA-binding PadR family transcriptional regulator